MDNNEIKISLSKTKLTLLTLGALMFVVIGFIMIKKSFEEFTIPSLLVIAIGLLSIVFFGLCFIYGIRKIFDVNPGLIINKKGFINNSNVLGGGFINWSDVEEIDSFQVQRQKFLRIKVKNSDSIIEMSQGFQKKLMQLNNHFYKSPIQISVNSLKINFYELENLFIQYWTTNKDLENNRS